MNGNLHRFARIGHEFHFEQSFREISTFSYPLTRGSPAEIILKRFLIVPPFYFDLYLLRVFIYLFFLSFLNNAELIEF